MKLHPQRGLTLLELLVVALIIAILTTIATVTVTGLVTRARISATFGTIRAMEIAADRYEIDLGEYPLSSTGTQFATAVNPDIPGTGCGYYLLGILHSISGTAAVPADPRWAGPYLDVDARQIGDVEDINATWGLIDFPTFGTFSGTETAATQQLLDAFGQPFRYIRAVGYETFFATEFPIGSPFALTETYFNFGRFQIVSLGPNGTTLLPPDTGLDEDDITNLGSGQ